MKGKNKLWAYALAVVMVLSIILTPINNSIPASGATPTSPANAFSDVAPDNPNLPFILYLSGRGILKGYAGGKFMPEKGLTHAEAATVIAKAAGLKITPIAKSPFRDVSSGYWAQAAIAAAAKAGYIKGDAAGRFLPEAKLTRAEGISWVMKLSKQPISGVTLPALSDVDNKHWAASSIAAALSAGMIELSSDGKSFLPNQPLTRAEMARALGVLLTKDPDLSSCALAGTVTVKKGKVTLLKKGAKTAQDISGTSGIKEGDVLSTGSDSEAEINFPDGSGFLVKPDSQLDIKTVKGRAYIKSDGTAGTGISMVEVGLTKGMAFGALATEAETEESATGAIGYERLASLYDNALAAAAANDNNKWYVASQQPVRIKVDMPWGVCSVRGTFWHNSVSPDGSGETSILTGHADVSGGGQTVALTDGQQTSSNGKGAPPAAPGAMSSDNKNKWSEATGWAKERASAIQKHQEINSKHLNAKSSKKVEEKVDKALKDNGSSKGNNVNSDNKSSGKSNSNSKSSSGSSKGKSSGGGKKK